MKEMKITFFLLGIIFLMVTPFLINNSDIIILAMLITSLILLLGASIPDTSFSKDELIEIRDMLNEYRALHAEVKVGVNYYKSELMSIDRMLSKIERLIEDKR